MPYMRRTIKSGRLLEIETYFATRDGKRVPRGQNVGDTSEAVADVNRRNAEKRLNRLICANFSREGGDLLLLLTHKRELTEAQAAREERNVLLRLQRALAKHGKELRYIAVTEKQGRWHHHIILNGGLTLEELTAVWGDRGLLRVTPLENTYTYDELARYLTREHKPPKGKPMEDSLKAPRRKWARRWHASRNLQQPIETKRIVKRPPSGSQPKPPKGYRLLPNWYVGCDGMGNLMTYYSCVEETAYSRRNGDGGGAPAGAGQSPAPYRPSKKKPKGG